MECRSPRHLTDPLHQIRYSLPVTEDDTFSADMWVSDRAGKKYDHFEVSCLTMVSASDDQLLRGNELLSDRQVCAIAGAQACMFFCVCACKRSYVRLSARRLHGCGNVHGVCMGVAKCTIIRSIQEF